jgi:conjugal transfer ATP-binding protein TraC
MKGFTIGDVLSLYTPIFFGIIAGFPIIGLCVGGIAWFWYKYGKNKRELLSKQEKEGKSKQEGADKYIIEETSITSGMELWGRKKNKFHWYPFDREIVINNNVAVVEGDGRASNDGLRFMQELSNSIIKQKDRVCILDAGRNFENEAQKFGKEYINIANDKCVCVNPFSVLHEVGEGFEADALMLVTSFIDIMVSAEKTGKQKDDGINRYLIKEGVKAVWKEKKEKAGISDFIKWMLQTESNPKENAEYVAGMLYRYGEAGKYGRYFNGKANIDVDDNFSAISFDEVEEVRKVLVAGVLTYIQVKDMQYGVKSYKGIILRDLIGDFKNKADQIFIEGYLRTQRLQKKGVISNISPQDEIFKLINESSSSTCCMNYDEEAISGLAEDYWCIWGRVKEENKCIDKHPEYLITAARVTKHIDKKTAYLVEDWSPCVLRGNLDQREGSIGR